MAEQDQTSDALDEIIGENTGGGSAEPESKARSMLDHVTELEASLRTGAGATHSEPEPTVDSLHKDFMDNYMSIDNEELRGMESDIVDHFSNLTGFDLLVDGVLFPREGTISVRSSTSPSKIHSDIGITTFLATTMMSAHGCKDKNNTSKRIIVSPSFPVALIHVNRNVRVFKPRFKPRCVMKMMADRLTGNNVRECFSLIDCTSQISHVVRFAKDVIATRPTAYEAVKALDIISRCV